MKKRDRNEKGEESTRRTGCSRCFIIKIGRVEVTHPARQFIPSRRVALAGGRRWWTMYAREDESGGTIKSFHYLN